MKKNKLHALPAIFVIFCCLIALFPVIYTISNSFMSVAEIMSHYQYYDKTAGISLHIWPDKFTFSAYYEMLFAQPDYLYKFWRSMYLAIAIMGGQLIIGVLAGYAFSKFRFPGRDIVFFLIIVIMMMPYQVTIVSHYIVFEKLNLLNTYGSLIVPGIFSAFAVFLMRQTIDGVPNTVIESAKLEGLGSFEILYKIVLPNCKAGLAALLILGFVDVWNMVEQPLLFLNDSQSYPLSLFLASINNQNLSLSFVCAVLAMLPVSLLFLLFSNELVEGISVSSIN